MVSWGVRRSDGTVERWEAVLYQPPLRVVFGWKKPPTARVVTPGSDFVIDQAEFIEVQVHSGPPAYLPNPPTACEFTRAIEEEWLLHEWELTI